MKQIKTVLSPSPVQFDSEVNAALAKGWTLVKRYTIPREGYVAEMEMEVITEEERCCENCAHYDKPNGADPCFSCSDDCDKWEGMVQ